MRVGVLGAGIGGLSVAAGLQRAGHVVTVVERRNDAGAIGSGLTLFDNAFAALEVMRLTGEVAGVAGSAMASMRVGVRAPSGRWLTTLPPASAASMRSVHRADLHRVLIDALAPGSLRTGSPALAAADGSAAVTVGSEVLAYDLVIVADGLRSENRARLGLDVPLRYAGFTAWRGVTRGVVDLGEGAGETWGRGRIFGIVPLPDGRVYWFATLRTPPGTAVDDEFNTVASMFGTWHAAVGRCLDATDPAGVLRHDIFDLARSPSTFSRGRTVLLGDAAHAMAPSLGQGAGQALEDAATLTALLRGAEPGDLDAILTRYDAARLRRTRSIAAASARMGTTTHLSSPLAVAIRDTVVRLVPPRLVAAQGRSVQTWTAP